MGNSGNSGNRLMRKQWSKYGSRYSKGCASLLELSFQPHQLNARYYGVARAP